MSEARVTGGKMKLTIETVKDCEPRKLAEALREECRQFYPERDYATAWETAFAAALLGVLAECEKELKRGTWRSNGMVTMTYNAALSEDIVRAAATAWLAAGGELEVED